MLQVVGRALGPRCSRSLSSLFRSPQCSVLSSSLRSSGNFHTALMGRSERHRRDAKVEEVAIESDPGSDRRGDDGDSDDCPFSAVFGSADSSIGTFLQNVQVLLQAASYIETAENNHGSESLFARGVFCLVSGLCGFRAELRLLSWTSEADNKGARTVVGGAHCGRGRALASGGRTASLEYRSLFKSLYRPCLVL